MKINNIIIIMIISWARCDRVISNRALDLKICCCHRQPSLISWTLHTSVPMTSNAKNCHWKWAQASKWHTCPKITLLKIVFLSLILTSKSMNVNLFVLTWNASLVHRQPENLWQEPVTLNYVIAAVFYLVSIYGLSLVRLWCTKNYEEPEGS